MDFITRAILNNKRNHMKTMVSRLCKRLKYTTTTNYTWALNTLLNTPEKCKYLLPCLRHQSIGNTEISIDEPIQANIHIPEHKIMHAMLENSVHYQESIVLPIKTFSEVSAEEIDQLYSTKWSTESALDVFKAVKKLTYCHLGGSRFETSLYNSILEACLLKLPEFTDQQLKTLLQYLIPLKDSIDKTYIYKKFMKQLDKQCINRFFRISITELLYITDAFYQLQYYEADCMWRMLRKVCAKVRKISGKELVQLLFLLHLANLPASIVNMFEIECRVEECMNDLSGNEIGIIARGFFLNKRKIRNKLLIYHIINKTTTYVDTMDSTTIGSIMKIIRFSDCVHCVREFQYLLEALRHNIARLPLKCLTHIMHASGGTRVYDEILTQIILERVKNELHLSRLKDIERIIYSISSVTPFTSYYTNMCHKLLQEITSSYKTYRASEVEKFPEILLRILTFLMIKKVYVPELIEYVFKQDFLKKAYKGNPKLITSELLTLHCSVKIELPEYKGDLLSDEWYKYLTKKYTNNDDVHRKDKSLTFKTELVFICKNKLGLNVYVDHILPCWPSRDIVFGMDEHNNPVEVESILSSMPTGSIKSVNSEDLKKIKWKVLFPLPILTKVLGHDGYIGPTYQKFRHYKLTGYTPIPVCEEKWISFSENEEKVNYLKQLIYTDTEEAEL